MPNSIILELKDLDSFKPSKTNLISFFIKENELSTETGDKILSFLSNLTKKNIKFKIVKPLPRCIFRTDIKEKIKRYNIPINCEDCANLFTKEDGYIKFCSVLNNKIGPRIDYMFNKEQISKYFQTFHNQLAPLKQCKSCFYFVRKKCNGLCFKEKKEIKKIEKKIKKVTLVWPLYEVPNPRDVPPNLSIAYLSKVLEKNGFEVACIDATYLFYMRWGYERLEENDKEYVLKKIVEIIEKTNPDLIGIGSWTHMIPFVSELSRLLKARNPDVPIVLGGTNPTVLPEETLGLMPHVDFLVRGEGDYVLLELIKKLNEGSWENVKGISYVKDKKLINNPLSLPIENLDELPFVDFENFIDFKLGNFVHILSARGCYGACTFCTVNANLKYYRYNSASYLLKQIEHILNLYTLNHISITDDNFLANNERNRKFAKLFIESGNKIQLTTATRSDCIDDETIGLLKKANFVWFSIGIENILPKVLSYYNKAPDVNLYLKKVNEGLKIMDKHKLDYAAHFILGAPIETKEDMMKNADYMIELSKRCARLDYSPLSLMPGSKLWQDYLKGELSVFEAVEPRFPFDEEYKHLAWAVPDAYLIRSKIYSDGEYKKIINEIMDYITKNKHCE